MVHDVKDLAYIFESWIHTLHSYNHLLKSWNKLLEVLEESSEELERTCSKGSEKISKLNLYFTMNFELLFQGYGSCYRLFIIVYR